MMFCKNFMRQESATPVEPRTEPLFRILTPTLVLLLLATGCSEEERREIRDQKERIALVQAAEQRIADQHRADLAAETNRLKNELSAQTTRHKDMLSAETDRRLNASLTIVAEIAAFLIAIGGVIGFGIFSFRRLGERHLEERTKRHVRNLQAIEADQHLTPEHRRELLRVAIETANRPGTPLISYSSNTGAAS